VNSVFGNLGIVGLAVCLTVLLLVGIKGGGKIKPLGWWPCLVLGMLAGSSYYAAGGVFTIIPDLVNGALSAAQGLAPGMTVAALALTMAIILGFKKLSTKQVAILGVVFWYAASGAGGVWGQVAKAIAALGTQVS
jgi:hypothetical protein